ncbi:MAG: single-stranded-DNA-specific exonuclease RecJ, partial [Firmicutes bacterium]|nr:single-stranded-DNA-specific exonuclease RecJ [Bacillota bacterium]
GIKLVITDHHDINEDENGKEILPDADIVVNPLRKGDKYPNKAICGAGVAFRLAEEIFRQAGVPEEKLNEFPEFLALATVCDVVDLRGENRLFVKEGLKALKHTENTGMRALKTAAGLDGRIITDYHLGFIIGPAVNAPGRLSSARTSVELFLSEDESRAKVIADYLINRNTARKELTQKGFLEAIDMIESKKMLKDEPLVVYLPECHESVAGIIAGRVREKYYRPTYILTNAAGGEIKGSGRGVEGYNMFKELCAVSDMLLRFGGHPMAAGMTLSADIFPKLRRKIISNAALSEEVLTRKVMIDVPLKLEDVSEELIFEIEKLSPFGKGNHKPIFAQKGLFITRLTKLGKNDILLKFRLKSPDGKIMTGKLFGHTEEFVSEAKKKLGEDVLAGLFSGKGSAKADFCYYPEINEWNGIREVELNIVSYRL